MIRVTGITPRSEPFTSHVERILSRSIDDPDAVMLSDRSREFTGRHFYSLVVRLAGALRTAGLHRGDRVAILPTISPEALAVRYAAGLLGCATVYCPNVGSGDRLARFVTRLRADALVVFPETADDARAVIATRAVANLVSVGRTPSVDVDLLSDDVGPESARLTSVAAPGDLAVLVSSGGTTGEPKAIRRSFASWGDLVDIGPTVDRRLLVCTAFAYIAQVLIDQVLVGGGVLVLRDRFDPQELLTTIEAERITHLCLVEPLLVELIDHLDLHRHDLSSLTAISHIGADAAPSLRRRLLQRAGPVLEHPYGASEVGIISSLAGAEYDLSRPALLATAGRPLPGVRVRIHGSDSRQVPPGQEGLIAVSSAHVSDGYDPVPPESGFRDGVYYTGDIGLLDAEGYLHVRGRAADLRSVNGRPVMPVDVQDALCAHPEVRYAVGVPLHGPTRGFGAAVLLAPAAGVGTGDLQAFVRERQGGHVVPEAIVIVDRIPITEQGKPDQAAISRLLAS
jgi:fatty-acyl-CoA synthase